MRSTTGPITIGRAWRWALLSLGLLMMLLLTALGRPPGASAATTWFVNAATGSDSNNCTSATTGGAGVGPCKTIGGAVSKAASAGDTIQVAAGTYDEHVGIPGTLTNLTITGAGASSTIVDGTNSGTVFVIGSGQSVMLENLTAQHGSRGGIFK